jgi:hypothetical protein
MPARFTLVAALGAALALAPAAYGGSFGVSEGPQPFQVGTGAHPDVAVDAAGTAHVVWNEDSGSVPTPDPLHYCRVPRGSTACDNSIVLGPPLEGIGRTSYVFAPSAGRVLIETYRCCGEDEGNYVYESTDGGQTFGTARRIGKLDHQSEAVFGPGEAISGASISRFQRMPLTGPPATTTADFDSGFPNPIYSGMGIFGTGTPVQVMSDGDDTSFVVNTGGSFNSSSQWSSATPLTPPGSESRVAGGPAGLVLLDLEGEPGERFLAARVFDGSGFGAPVTVSEKADPIFFDLWAEPSTGRFHAVWIANGQDPDELRWAFSDDGTTWSEPQAVFRGDVAEDAYHLQVSAAPDGEGFAVWDGNSANTPIRMVQLKEGLGVGTGGSTGSDGSADTRTDSVTVGGQELTLLAPGACVNPGTKVKLRVTSKTKRKLSPKKRVKIVYVVFSFDKKKKKDKKAAFKASFSTKGLTAGSKHKLRAKIRLKPVVGKGKQKTRTLKGSLTICG